MCLPALAIHLGAFNHLQTARTPLRTNFGQS